MNKPNNQNNYVGRVSDSVTRQEADSVVSGEMSGYAALTRPTRLIDLKIGKLSHGNLGQMQMYVNYFDHYVKLADEQPTIGIVLCKKKHDALVEITLPKDANIHAREYSLYLPDKELLRRKLTEWGENIEDERDE
ncbi:PDDEXK nuclease domain-containing protein [Methylicorpusculum sp.]|uniref:PDDEXK nuclease domain-containing protein n=1 Tax=Methylicorpusculum sp. TaxID=2713644 RepID=UPI002724BABE|nr:PDDEXK nuclease domain-containing protein [Methylicorpusculum sp.]MDO8845444.1 PDDEXK nuclease domain-containing protein [Methylicorpusculum sp.]